MKQFLLLLPLVLITVPVGHSPNIHNAPVTTVTTVKPSAPLLNLTLLSVNVNSYSQIANINASWTGPGYYVIDPSSFHLIITTRNAVYSNNTDISSPNETTQWYLLHNIPITIRVSFLSTTPIAQEKLVYADGANTITF